MSKLHRYVAVSIFLGLFCAQSALACRYNVRDIGFVDLGDRTYYLYGYVDQNTPADIISSFREVSDIALVESNIRFEMIDTNRQNNHSAIKYLRQCSIKTFPAAVLVSPDERSLPIAIAETGVPFARTLRLALSKILSSPKREEIIEEITKKFGAIFLIEGSNAQENERIREASVEAIEEIRVQMKTMPKVIAEPPVLVTLPAEMRSQEKVLLWSLGVDAERVDEAQAFVVYGRAKLIGPRLSGEEITGDRLANILYVIGSDCECGLDRKWMQGMTLPARWGGQILSEITKTLEFDPENPMVKMEVSRILRNNVVSTDSKFLDLDSLSGPSFGYQELVVEFNSPAESQQVAPSQQDTLPPASLSDSGVAVFEKMLVVFGILAILILVTGTGVLLKARKK